MTAAVLTKKTITRTSNKRIGRMCGSGSAMSGPTTMKWSSGLNALARGPLHPMLNFFHASLKLEHKERTAAGKMRRVYKKAQTPLQRVLDSPEIPESIKAARRAEKAGLNAFALKAEIDRQLGAIAALRRPAITVSVIGRAAEKRIKRLARADPPRRGA